MKNRRKIMLTATMEDYLKAILTLETLKKYVRVRDIAQKMNVRVPTVTSMMTTLAERNLVSHEKYEHVELTGEGTRIAREILERHTTLRKFLVEVLRVDEKTAEKDACEMEHAVSTLTLARLVAFMEVIKNCSSRKKDSGGNAREYAHDFVDCLEKMKRIKEDSRSGVHICR